MTLYLARFSILLDLQQHESDECPFRPRHCPIYGCKRDSGGGGGVSALLNHLTRFGSPDHAASVEFLNNAGCARASFDHGQYAPIVLLADDHSSFFVVQLAELDPSAVYVWVTAMGDDGAKNRGIYTVTYAGSLRNCIVYI